MGDAAHPPPPRDAGKDASRDAARDAARDTGTNRDATSPPPPPPPITCAPFPAPKGNVIDVTPAQAGDLAKIVDAANSGDTISLADGTYALNGLDVSFRKDNVTLRGKSGNREAVILDGAYMSPEILSILASNITIADVTLKRAYNHPIHASG